MATVSEAVRRLTIEATSRGVDQATASLSRLSQAQDGVAVSAQRQERATASVESRLNTIQRRYDESFRAQMELARVDRTLQAAQAQGLITEQRRLELINLTTAAVTRQNSVVAANDNQWRRRNLTFQLFDVGQMLAMGQAPGLTALQQGPQIAQLYAGQGGVNAALRETGSLLGGVVRAFPMATAAAVAGGVAFAGMAYEINQTTEVAVGFGDVVMGTLEALVGVIYDELQPAINAVAPWFASAWQMVIDGTKLVGNTIINSFRAAFEDLKLVFTQFPNIVAVAIGSAANLVVAGVEQMINVVVTGIDAVIAKVNGFAPEGLQIGQIGAVQLGRVNMGTAPGELAAALRNRNQNIADIMGSDPLGDFYQRVRSESIENAIAGQKDKKGGKSEAERLAERYAAITRDARQATQAFNNQEAALYMTEEAAAALAYQQDLLNKAEDAGIKLTAAQRDELLGLGSAMAEAEMSFKRAQEALEFNKELAGGFIKDLISGVKEGKNFWDAFASAATNALDKITDKLLNEVLDALFQVNNAGGGLGGIGGILGSILGIFGNGTPTYAPVPAARPFAKGGVIDQPTIFPFARGVGLMGEAGPEAIMPLRRDGQGRLGVAANQNGGFVNQVVINNAPPGSRVREERSRTADGRELRRTVIDIVREGEADGAFDGVRGARYGAQPVKVAR